jgi:hypothetical protein
MSAIKADTTIRRVELAGSRIDDEMVFFDQEAGKYYATGSVGADIWEFLDAPRSFAAICDHLLDLYDVDHATCEAQVRGFLSQLLDARMVTAEPGQDRARSC